MGLIDMPFAALDMTLDGRRFISWCFPSCVTKWIPAAETSAPESGRPFTTVDLLGDVKPIITEGAGADDGFHVRHANSCSAH